MSELKPIQITVSDKMILAAPQCDQMDEVHTQDMQSKVTAAARQSPRLPVVLDMSRVSFVPSLSLGALVTLLKTCKQNNQRFMLAGLQPPIREVMTACRLDRLFEIYDSLDDAQARLSV
jgi:anti-sigma B factor antagonist